MTLIIYCFKFVSTQLMLLIYLIKSSYFRNPIVKFLETLNFILADDSITNYL